MGRAVGVVEIIVHKRQRAGGRAVGVIVLILVDRPHPRSHRGIAEHRAENVGGAQPAQDVPAQPGSGGVAAVCAVVIDDLPVGCVVGVGLQQHIHVVPEVGKTKIPHFVLVLQDHAQVGVQRRIDRIGLRRGVGIDAVRAVADEVGHIGEIIIRRLHRQTHIEILAAFVGQHHHLFPVTLVANVDMGGIGWLLGGPIIPFSIGVSVQDEAQKGVTLEGRLDRRVEIGTQRTRIGAARSDRAHELHIGDAGVGGVRGIAARIIKSQIQDATRGIRIKRERGGGQVARRIVTGAKGQIAAVTRPIHRQRTIVEIIGIDRRLALKLKEIRASTLIGLIPFKDNVGGIGHGPAIRVPRHERAGVINRPFVAATVHGIGPERSFVNIHVPAHHRRGVQNLLGRAGAGPQQPANGRARGLRIL